MATPGPNYNGWKFNRDDARLEVWQNGVLSGYFDGNGDLNVTDRVTAARVTLSGDAALNTGSFGGNLTLESTLTAGADGVGTDGEQLTSGGAAAECDWSAAGSLRAFKNLLRKRDDAEDVLQMIADTPVYDFQYKRKGETDERITSTGDVETIYTGIVADEAPWAMHHNGRILNPINTFGYTMLAIKALLARVEDLEGQLKVARA